MQYTHRQTHTHTHTNSILCSVVGVGVEIKMHVDENRKFWPLEHTNTHSYTHLQYNDTRRHSHSLSHAQGTQTFMQEHLRVVYTKKLQVAQTQKQTHLQCKPAAMSH